MAVSSQPSGAKVYIDDAYKGVTPLTLTDMSADIYKVELIKEGYEPYSISVSVGNGYTQTVSKELSEKAGLSSFVPIALVFFLLVGIVIKRKSSRGRTKPNKSYEVSKGQRNLVVSTPASTENTSKAASTNNATVSKPSGNKSVFSMKRKENNVDIKSAFSYKGATIQHKVKVENPTSEPIADVKVNLYVPDVFILSESTKSIPIIKPSESKTVTFDIRPTGECGDCQVSGKVIYYNYKTKETTEAAIPPRNVSIVCPMLRSKEITESEWRNSLTNLTKAEESTEEIDIPASTLFDIISDVLQDMNLFMLEPKVNDSGNLYRAVSKFYGEGVKSQKYAAQIEVVGSPSKSKLILKAWAESEDALAGFYHGILNEIEKRVQVKSPINTTVVNNYHYGNSIGTQIMDSVVQRSNIGNSSREQSTNEKEAEDGQGMNYTNVYNYLIGKAKKRSVVTYGEVISDLGEEFSPKTRDKLISLLDQISIQNIEKGEPLLTALVINKLHKMPGKRFFIDYMSTYRNFSGNPEGNEAKMAYEQELERVWNYW